MGAGSALRSGGRLAGQVVELGAAGEPVGQHDRVRAGGGALTAWIIGKTDRFRAAAVQKPVIELARQQQARPRFDPSAGRSVQHVFLVRGKLLSKGLLCRSVHRSWAGRLGWEPTISAHRLRRTIGSQLAEGGARLLIEARRVA